MASVHFPALDGLRAIAIIGVLLSHTLLIFARYGGYGRALEVVANTGAFGVDLFFVLSGFLITGILLDTPKARGYFRNFYARRCLRLFPVFYGYLMVVMFVLPFVHRVAHTSMRDYTGNWLWYLTYFCNWKSNFAAEDPYLGHFWSLAVEEQFYLAWPLIVFLTNRRQLFLVCVILIVAASALRGVWSLEHVYWNQIYRLTVTRCDTIAFGALAALAIRSDAWRRRVDRASPWLAAIGLFGFLGVACWQRSTSWNVPAIQTYGATLAAVGFTGVVLMIAGARWTVLGHWLGGPALRSIGKYSYSMYVLHLLVFMHVQSAGDLLIKRSGLPALPLQIAAFIATNLLVYLIAAACWKYLEAPVLNLKHRFVQAPLVEAWNQPVAAADWEQFLQTAGPSSAMRP